MPLLLVATSSNALVTSSDALVIRSFLSQLFSTPFRKRSIPSPGRVDASCRPAPAAAAYGRTVMGCGISCLVMLGPKLWSSSGSLFHPWFQLWVSSQKGAYASDRLTGSPATARDDHGPFCSTSI